MTLEDLKADLPERLGHKVVDLQSRDGDPVAQMDSPTLRRRAGVCRFVRIGWW